MRRCVQNAFLSLLLSCAIADAESLTLGPFGFTNTPVSYPQFASPSGYLHSITLEVTNLVVQQDIIIDNDSTDVVAYARTIRQYVDMIGSPAHPVPLNLWYGTFAQIVTNVNVHFESVDDGDGPGSRNGGSDESSLSVVFSNIYGQIVLSNSYDLARHTGDGTLPLLVTRFRNTLYPGTIAIYPTNEVFSGEIFVHYECADTPLTPRVVDVLVQHGTVSLLIEDLSVGSSNTIQRSFDLRGNSWTDVGVFVSSTWIENWIECISNEWGAAFYRVRSK